MDLPGKGTGIRWGWELEISGGKGIGIEGENVGIVTGTGEPLGPCGNLVPWTLPGIYEVDPKEDFYLREI